MSDSHLGRCLVCGRNVVQPHEDSDIDVCEDCLLESEIAGSNVVNEARRAELVRLAHLKHDVDQILTTMDEPVSSPSEFRAAAIYGDVARERAEGIALDRQDRRKVIVRATVAAVVEHLALLAGRAPEMSDTIVSFAKYGEHIALKCRNHPNKRWNTKNIAPLGCRNIIYNLWNRPDMGAECSCRLSDLEPCTETEHVEWRDKR